MAGYIVGILIIAGSAWSYNSFMDYLVPRRREEDEEAQRRADHHREWTR
jgi:hypothetical protein